ncbi:MAG TPA: hypothetical protein VFT22_13510 [Kofleriaceae bacterium]|nr:hypothetical protein [Kofleriaceae bacterium]
MGVAVARALVLVVAVLVGGIARAQPGPSTSEVLREGNTAALAGDWARVSELVEPLFQRPLASADLGEAHRLAGIAAYFQHHEHSAETHFLDYLRIDLDGRLDPALYPPEVVAFFNDVASRHAAELRALRIGPRRSGSWLYALIPPVGQFQNGERIKGYVIGGALGALLIANLTTYYYLRTWCNHTTGTAGGGLTCDDNASEPDRDLNHEAARLRPWNIASGIGFLVVYAYGVYDGVAGYRRKSRERAMQPFVAASAGNHVFGLAGSF